MGQACTKQEMFWEACGFGRTHLVQMFIEHGIDVNWVSSVHACSPIHVASQGKPDVVRLLIDAGCDLSVVDSRGHTSIHHAAMKGHADIIEMLVQAGADIDAQDKNGWTPLHCAAYYAHSRAVDVLLKRKATVNILNKDGRSALVETARSKHEDDSLLGEIAHQLIKAGCDVNLKCTDLGETDFTGLMFAAYHDHCDVALTLIKGGCDINCSSCYTKWTALHWATDRDNAKMVRLLLNAGADPTRPGMRGELASSRVKSEDIKEMLENAVATWSEGRQVEKSSTFMHSFNAKASLDSARSLESLSAHAKNRDFLATPMPTFPALGISSRSDPKIRYTKRSVNDVASKSLNSLFPWKSYSRQGSQTPDRDGVMRDMEKLQEKLKSFPSHDDKTNAFMDSLAQRINYMTNRIATIGGSVTGQGDRVQANEGTKLRSSSEETLSKVLSETDISLQDSGLSTLNNSTTTSELCSPDEMTNSSESRNQPQSKFSRSPKLSNDESSSKVVRSSRSSILDKETDACIIEASYRGFSILHALQERHRHSIYLADVAGGALPGEEIVIKPQVMSQV